jgi:DNA-binding response OmpR family regulator
MSEPSPTSAERAGPQGRLAVVVDDEPGIVKIVTSYLEREGFRVLSTGNGEEAVALVRCERPDVVVLDLMLPGIDGIEACRRIRSFSDAYVIILTARAEDIDKIVGLATGADDYMTKPFSPGELVARVRALLRRPRGVAETSAVRRFGALEIDPLAHEVRLDGAVVELTRLEFELLDALSAEPRVAFTRGQLLARVWGTSWFGDDHVVDVHVANLRRKLGDDAVEPRFVRTVRGVGYRMGEG